KKAEKTPLAEGLVDMDETNSHPRIDVMFVLDTTGSMSGLIAAAQDKIWSIATTFTQAQKQPKIRFGLVGYRDRGDDYVTRHVPLTGDLDLVYRKLMKFRAGGGGDTPESVNQALHEAVTQTDWHKGKKTLRIVFLVGDAPPKMNYQDDVRYSVTCKSANEDDIVINTIQCGNIAATTPVWKEIATLGEGKFIRIAQSGGQRIQVTPYDDQILQLNIKLEATRCYWGGTAIRAAQKVRAQQFSGDKISSGAYGKASLARRAQFNASAAGCDNFLGSNELVCDFRNKKVDLSKMKKDELPESMRSMSLKEQEAHLTKLATERDALRAEIEKLSKVRQTYIVEQLAKQKAPVALLDNDLFDAVKEQAAEKGIHYGAAGPAY
ncbi:MAG: vWA domain-containing protein, partial [Planctomycetota bacterium]